MKYDHTQTGYLMIYVLIAVALLFTMIGAQAGWDWPIVFIELFVFAILGCFTSMRVVVDEKQVRVRIGPGIFQKRFLLEKIKSARAVRNKWVYGWGIRVWFWPYMWIYNISGFDAVEIVLENGHRYRIGTDEPKKLERAITQAI